MSVESTLPGAMSLLKFISVIVLYLGGIAMFVLLDFCWVQVAFR